MKVFSVYLIISFCLLFTLTAYPQTSVIKGSVRDTLNQIIPFAGIVLENHNGIVVTYTQCNKDGDFTLPIKMHNVNDKYNVAASSLGYKKQQLLFTGANHIYNFTLSLNIKELETVIFKDKRPKLNVSGDTTNYNVDDFSTGQDRVLADVLKKLPGISVSGSGRISYNGKDISNFYINGDDLLDDKYNIATATLPNDIIKNVQIIENHQPIKILRSKTFSDNVALNITFKKDAKLKLLGQAALSGGFTNKYAADINGMSFKDSYKAINYLKANNTGVNLANDLTAHNATEYLKRTDNAKPNSVLSLGSAGSPNLPENRYLFNHGLLVSLNNLININKSLQLKANVSYLRDKQKQQYAKYEDIYSLKDTISYFEGQTTAQKINAFSNQINLVANTDKYYFNNTLLFNLYNSYSNAVLQSNINQSNQNLSRDNVDFSNELNFLKPLKNGLIINYYSYINYYTKPEALSITPGLNPSLFNNGSSYQSLNQQIDIPTWAVNNCFSTRYQFGAINLQQKAGFNLQSQIFRSDLLALQNNNLINSALDSANNNLKWLNKKLYTESEVEYLSEKAKVSVSLPFSLQQISYNENQYQLAQSSVRYFFTPSLRIKYQTGLENYISLNYNLNNDIGNINDVFRGYVLKNYRSLSNNISSALAEQKSHNASLSFNYRKGIKLFFFSTTVFYKNSTADNISSSIVTTDFDRRVNLPFKNNSNSLGISSTISKYLFFLNTTAKFSPTAQLNNLVVLQNGNLLPYKVSSIGVNLSFDTKISERFNISYNNNVNYFKSFFGKATVSSVGQTNQHASVTYNPFAKLYLSLSGDYYSNNQNLAANKSQFFFTDFKTNFNFTKKKISLEFNILNLLDTRNYGTGYLSGNVFSSAYYNIPGRIVIGKIAFNY